MRTSIVVLAALLSACTIPRSTTGHVAFSGYVIGSSKSEQVSLDVTLPKNYGLGRLDLLVNTPEDFGHKDQTIRVQVVDGRFSVQFPPVDYHANVWFLPPIGASPKQPPKPTYSVSFSDASDEVYVVGFDRDSFKYRVFSRASGREITPDLASWVFTRGVYVPVRDGESEVWHVQVEVSKPGKGLRPTAPPPLRSGKPAA